MENYQIIMSYYRKRDFLYAYNNESYAFNIGKETKDSYTLLTFYKHNIIDDSISYTAEVIKNWTYGEIPSTGKTEGKKYKEIVFTGTLAQCVNYIQNIVDIEGHWDKHPDNIFEQIFIEPNK